MTLHILINELSLMGDAFKENDCKYYTSRFTYYGLEISVDEKIIIEGVHYVVVNASYIIKKYTIWGQNSKVLRVLKDLYNVQQ